VRALRNQPVLFATQSRKTTVISFIIPAHNEEAYIGRTLAAVHAAAGDVGEQYEVIVANDASTDRTRESALAHGAKVLDVNRRHIAATRNAGARAAAGDILVFVDADTLVTGAALRAAVRALGRGAIGGSSCVHFDAGRLPVYAAVLERVLPVVQRAIGLPVGCFVFCSRRAYLAAGGFNEALYWGEELDFGRRLKRQGRFVILRAFVITSGRKVRSHSLCDLLRVGARLALSDPLSERRRKGLEYWYGPGEPATKTAR